MALVREGEAAQATAPGVLRELRSRGVATEPLPGEGRESFQDRLDTELMALFRDTGSSEVFDALYRHARGRVFRWLRWLARRERSSLDPLDLLQDTFVNVYRYAKGFRSDQPASFRAWSRTIGANALRRALARRPRAALHALPSGLQEPADPAGGPHCRLVTGEEREALHMAWLLFLEHYARAWRSLSPRDRLALRLVEIEGLSYAETGERLNVGPSNMKMIMLRARRRLHRSMGRAMGREATSEKRRSA